MDVEFFIHGVPLGAKQWKDEDKDYFRLFHNNKCLDKLKFLIDIRISKGKLYCYYNYLIYEAMADREGRLGAYFGISLRLDAYCKDFMSIYNILDIIYREYVIDGILKPEKAKLVYITNDFASKSELLKKMEDSTLQMFQKAFTGKSFVALKGFPSNGSKCFTYNIYDCTADDVQNVVRQNGQIALSPYYPSYKETAIKQQCENEKQAMQSQCQTQTQTMQQKFDEQLNAERNAYTEEMDKMKAHLADYKNQIAQFRNEVTQKDKEIKLLHEEVSRLQSQNKKIGQIRNISQIVEPMREPIAKVALALQNIEPMQENRWQTRLVRYIKKLFAFVIYVLLFLLLYYIADRCIMPLFDNPSPISK